VVDVEVTSPHGGKTGRVSRDSPFDPAHGPGESIVGAPRIHGELLKLGIEIGETTVAKYMGRRSPRPLQSWRTFLENHLKELVSVDFFTVPTIRFQVLYVFLVLAHDRRRIVHWNVTCHPQKLSAAHGNSVHAARSSRYS
jgi:hypothetical protein